MKLRLTRRLSTAKSTSGELSIDGVFQCFTLEDPVRDHKIPGVTAIPAGTYAMAIRPSPKFHRLMPALEAVPGFEGILIHWGNTATDTLGCILVGETRSTDFVGASRKAFDTLFPKLRDAFDGGNAISIEIVAAAA